MSGKNAWREVLIAGGLVLAVAGLVIAAVVVPHDRGRFARDPTAQQIAYLRAISVGMQRKVVESQLHFWYARADQVEVFEHPDTPHLRLDIRFTGPGQDDQVVAVGEPYLGLFPQPDHLLTVFSASSMSSSVSASLSASLSSAFYPNPRP